MNKKPDNSPNYKSFFTRDYKSFTPRTQVRQSPLTKLHVVLILAAVLVVGTLLTFFSMDAQANRTPVQLDTPQPVATLPESPTTTPATPQANSGDTLSREWFNESVGSGDSMAKIFNRLKLPPTELHNIMQNAEAKKYLHQLQPGQLVKLLVDDQQVVHTLIFEINRFDSFAMQRDGSNGYIASSHRRNVEKRIHHAVSTIDSSLFEAGQRAGLSDPLILELAGIFGWDIDFALDIREGDRFAVLFEEHFLEGEKIAQGPVLAAEFVSQGQTYRAVRYTDADGHNEYFTPEGQSMRKAFLRTPVDFRRISSRFGSRKHPILNRMKMHKGVDYSAPVGTPVHASGDGKIVYKGGKGGYGRTLIIQHGGNYSTLYAHLSAFKKNVDIGSRVKQGQVIGYVGSSGLATGPHLHYEFRVNGSHRNPLTIKLPSADPISPQLMAEFVQQTRPMLATLDNIKQQTNVALSPVRSP